METIAESSHPEEQFAVTQIRNLGQIGIRYHVQKQPEKAARVFYLALEIAESTFEPYDTRIIAALMDVSWFYAQWPARPPEAQALCRRTLKLCEEALGYYSRNTLSALANLIIVVTRDSENYPEDYEHLLRRAVERYRALEGPESGEMLAFMENLSIYLQSRGRLAEAAEVLQERLRILKATKGNSDELTHLAASKLAANSFAHCYYMTMLEKSPHHDIECLRLILRVIELCIEFVQIAPLLLLHVGRMFKYTRDDQNTHIAFQFVTTKSSIKFGCNGCRRIIDRHDFVVICRTCIAVSLCRSCYGVYQNNKSRPQTIPEECTNHSFLNDTINESEPKDLPRWLQEVRISKLETLKKMLREEDSQHSLKYYEGQSVNANYEFGIPEGVPDDLGDYYSWQGKSPAWRENIARIALDLRFLQVKERVPRMLENWFSSADYQSSDLPEWNEDADRTVELRKHVDAIFQVALGYPTSEPDQVVREAPYRTMVNSVYDDEDLVLNPEIPQIRILKLISCSDRKIWAEMTRVNLDENPSYDALSYVWGPPDCSAQYVLEVNNSTLGITPNLHAALSALIRDSSLQRLWVDAVCINQEDLQEKACQIAMMADIYRSAASVRIYLGSGLPLITKLLQYFDCRADMTGASFANVNWEDSGDLDPTGDLESKLPMRAVIAELGIPNELILREYVDFISRAWWTRVWVLQEYILAKNDPILYLGSNPISSSVLQRWGDDIGQEMLKAAVPFSGTDVDIDAEYMSASMELKHLQMLAVLNNRPVHRPLATFSKRPFYFFNWYFRSQSTDPRDKVFGLRELFDSTAKDAFRPDYTRNVIAVYQKLAAWLLMFDGEVEIFWRYPLKIAPGAPSWVPDFARPHSWTPEESEATNLTDGEASSSLTLGFREWDLVLIPPREQAPPPVIYGRVLAIGGRYFDTIDHVFVVKDGSWHERLAKLWYLDVLFTTTTLGGFHQSSGLFCPLLESHARDMLFAWTARFNKESALRTMSVASTSQTLSVTEFYGIVDDEFRDIASKLKDTDAKDLSLLTTGHTNILSLTLGEALSFGYNRSANGMSVALQKVVLNLSVLQGLLTALDRPLNFLGAALFDYHNLERQIRHLREPRLTPVLAEEVAEPVLSRLQRLADLSFPELDKSDRHSPPYGLKAHIYTDIQECVAACGTKQEVRLRAALVLRIAQALRKASARSLSAAENEQPVGDAHVGIGDYLEPDWDILKDNISWLQADDAAIIRMRNLTCGACVAAIAAFLYGRTPAAQPLSKYVNITTFGFVACAALGFFNLRNRPQLTSEMVKQWGFPNPTLDEVEQVRTQRLEFKEKQRQTLIAQGKRKDFTRLSQETETQWRNRTFYVTKRGFVGLGTPGVTNIRKGDKVIWLDHARLPMVAREKVGTEHLHIVGFSIVREFIHEDLSKLEDFKKLRKKVFKFV